jgi:tetratricopeptide (TPR) repeat protein
MRRSRPLVCEIFRVSLIVCALAWPVVATECFAQNLIGKKVTVIKWDAEFRSEENKVIGTSELGKNYEVYTAKGNKLFVRERDGYILRADVVLYDTAVNHFTTIVKRKHSANAYYDRGVALEEREELDEALKDYNEAIRRNAKFSEVYNARANIWSQKGELDKALDDYGKSLQLDPMSALVLCNRGMVWVAKEDYDRALVDYNEAIRIDPNYADTYRERAEVWQKKSKLDKAIADYDQALRLQSADQESRLNRAFLRGLQGADDDAITDYNELLRREPNHARALQLRGLIWLKKGVYVTAAADLEQAIEADPTDFNLPVHLALLRAACPDDNVRNGRNAMELMTKAKELGDWKKSYSYRATWAAAHAELGDFEKAIEVESKLNDRVPEGLKAEHAARLKLYQDRKPYRLKTVPPTKKVEQN